MNRNELNNNNYNINQLVQLQLFLTNCPLQKLHLTVTLVEILVALKYSVDEYEEIKNN